MRRSLLLAAAVIALAACQESTAPVEHGGADPSLSASRGVAGRFIVTLQAGVSPAAVARGYGVRPDYVYSHALNGFAGAMSDLARQGLLRDRRVALIEPDGIATIVGSQSITDGGLWGLDRIDDRSSPRLDNNYSYTSTGAGVRVYIIDTGIRTSHQAFGGRASSGYSSINDGRGTNDCHGHGTHVAGTVGGGTYGVAKGASLVAVRVLDCGGSGAWSGVIAGIDWVTANRVRPAVANLSLGGSGNTSVDNAIKKMIAAGVATAVAAGNGNNAGIAQDACRYSPARVPAAMTIGATDRADKRASFSNYGSCLDWFAPGVGVKSAWSTSNTATNTISGTSMASPHTAGVAALYLQSNRGASPLAVRDALYANTTKAVVTSSRTGNNHLLFTSY